MRRLLLVNPAITDVAAFDLWAWPLGLLYWAAHLRDRGFEVALIDCADRAHPALGGKSPPSKKFHTGKYFISTFEPQPEPARKAGRLFRTYGLPSGAFERELESSELSTGAPPDAVLVTSRMTYWYPGALDAIRRIRARWPSVPTALGGVYPTLCPKHARAHSGGVDLFTGNAREALPRWLANLFPETTAALRPLSADPDEFPHPALDLCNAHDALPLLTSIGCPFRCSYCASRKLAPIYHRRRAESVFQELLKSHERWGTTDFTFYDDALLVDAERCFEPLLDRVIASGLEVRFHTPNGMHYAMLTEALAVKMRRAGVTTVRLSLETEDPAQLKTWGREGNREDFLRAVRALREAGYRREDIGVYVMAGMPGQSADSVRRAIETVHAAGAVPKLNEYSPIPGTVEWERALAVSGREIEEEPLWQNNSLYYTRSEIFPRVAFEELKRLARSEKDEAETRENRRAENVQ